MKSIKKILPVLIALLTASIIFASCASEASKKASKTKALEKVVVLDDKGAAFGITTPEWVTAYIMNGNSAVQKMSAYNDKYCFVVENNNASRDFAIAAVQNASGPRAIADKISTTVSSSVSTKVDALSAAPGAKAEMEQRIKTATEQLTNASFNGAAKEADWWQTVENKTSKNVETRAYALWLIDKKSLDTQVAAQLQRLQDQNKAMSEAEKSIYADLIKQIRGTGGFGSIQTED
ncbi:MAG: hypothetical protein Ta2B_08840 [Termitinemataceae bacterium]|nr:MAG: hypothetical protein Ta2B_08840 [Termitinemataceae bacterium]